MCENGVTTDSTLFSVTMLAKPPLAIGHFNSIGIPNLFKIRGEGLKFKVFETIFPSQFKEVVDEVFAEKCSAWQR